ncbi:MAG: hypothetical protein LBH54_01840 [Clostridiales bacterium]|jgi:hypothetical protein|nr:hypothetical protein [Clostridiales bacterium]
MRRVNHTARRTAVALIAASIACVSLPRAASAAYTITVEENAALRPSDRRVLGLNDDIGFFGSAANGSSAAVRNDFAEAFQKTGVGFPIARAFLHTLNWKETVGALESRGVNDFSQVYTFGLAEWIRARANLTPNAAFAFTIRVEDDLDNLRDLVRFLTLMPSDPAAIGADGVNWASRRVEAGIAEPVNLAALELGNETDWFYFNQILETDAVRAELAAARTSAQKQAIYDRIYGEAGDMYAAWCRAIVPALREVNPNVPLAVQSCTTPHESQTKYSVFNTKINLLLKELSDRLDYIVVHCYYHNTGSMYRYFNADSRWTWDGYGICTDGLPAEKMPAPFLSEHAVFGGVEHYNTASRTIATGRAGTLSTADMVNRLIKSPDAPIAVYHTTMDYPSAADAFGGGVWGLMRAFPDFGFALSGVGEFFKLASDAFGVDSVRVTGDNMRTTAHTLTVSAHTTAEGGLNLLAVNASNAAHTLDFSTQNNYKLEKRVTLTAASDASDNGPLTDITAPDAMVAKAERIHAADVPAQTIGAKTITAYYLVPTERQYTANDAVSLRVNGVPADTYTAPVVTAERVRVEFSLFENGALNGVSELTAVLFASDPASPELTPDGVIYMAQADGIARNRGYFEALLPPGLPNGEYFLRVGAGAAQKTVRLDYRASGAVTRLEPLSQPNGDYETAFHIYWNDARTRDGERFGVTLTSAADGELRYAGAGTKFGAAQRYELLFPRDAVSGAYRLRITTEHDVFETELDFVKPGEAVRVIAPLRTEDGARLTLGMLTEERTAAIGLQNLGDAAIASVQVYLAFYDGAGNLTAVAVSEAEGVAAGGEISPLVRTPTVIGAALARALILEDNSLRPLTDVYLIKE